MTPRIHPRSSWSTGTRTDRAVMLIVGAVLAAVSATFFVAGMLGAGVSLAALCSIALVAFVFAELDAHDDAAPALDHAAASAENAI